MKSAGTAEYVGWNALSGPLLSNIQPLTGKRFVESLAVFLAEIITTAVA
jgi:hypothetical protein